MKKEEKKAVSKTTKKTPENKQNNNQEKVLAIAFVALAILVIILLIIALNQKNARKAKEESHITIPVLDENTKSHITINLKEFKEANENEYIFIVSNYREGKINKQELEYVLNIKNSDNVDIKLFKNDSNKNILEDDLEIEDNKLQKDKKQEDIYRLVITKNDKIKDDSVIDIEVDS